MNYRQLLITKYTAYHDQGLAIFTVTLSTYLQEQRATPDAMFQTMWSEHFIYKVRKHLPITAQLDHDYVVELSPAINRHKYGVTRYYGYHGFIAIDSRYLHRLWANGCLNRHLVGALKSFRRRGLYRPFCINSFLIEPAQNIESWSLYITKTNDYLASTL
jgi:hypothetical protein